MSICIPVLAAALTLACTRPVSAVSWNKKSRVFGWWGGEVTLPVGFNYQQDVGADTDVGHFTSPDGKLRIEHDIGGYAGAWANRREAITFEERVINGSRALIAQRKWPDGSGGATLMFAVTFPDNGCANFFLTSNNVADAWPIQRIAQSFRPKGKSDGGRFCER
jgi:hypothetical protein